MKPLKSFSFSIASLLLATALVASLTSNYLLRRDYITLEENSEKMSTELQLFEVLDKEKIHILELDEPSYLVWRYRIYVPPKQQVQLCWSIGPNNKDEHQRPMSWGNQVIEGQRETQTVSLQILRTSESRIQISQFLNRKLHRVGYVSNAVSFEWLFKQQGYPNLANRALPAAINTAPRLEDWGNQIMLLEIKEQQLPAMLASYGNEPIAMTDAPNHFKAWLEPVDSEFDEFYLIPTSAPGTRY